jgi:hypothetical protein
LGELREEDEDESGSWTSGGSSPRSVDSAVAGMRGVNASGAVKPHHNRQTACACRRAPVLQQYPRCQYCLRDAGWMSF